MRGYGPLNYSSTFTCAFLSYGANANPNVSLSNFYHRELMVERFSVLDDKTNRRVLDMCRSILRRETTF